MSDSPAAELHERLTLDGTKIAWWLERVRAWERGERIAPVTIDGALSTRCNAACQFCYASLQTNAPQPITTEVMYRFLDDCAELGVKGFSLVSDGESTLSKAYVPTIQRGHELGIGMASGTNGFLVDRETAEQILPCLTYLRINFSAGTRERYAQIMGTKRSFYDRVLRNIEDMVAVRRERGLKATLGLQMVLRPQDADQIIPFAELAVSLGVQYGVIKHCSDDEFGSLGVDYGAYERCFDLLKEAEALSTPTTQIVAKWNKIKAGNKRSYRRCFGPPFILQFSGSGLIAPCGQFFNQRYERFHIGNLVTERFRDIVRGDRYWEVMRYLSSEAFDAQKMCGVLCLADRTNVALDRHKKGLEVLTEPTGPPPPHVNFI
jgi:MoaA/NifB/PqqE/SkfB family radical SAM enzyme